MGERIGESYCSLVDERFHPLHPEYATGVAIGAIVVATLATLVATGKISCGAFDRFAGQPIYSRKWYLIGLTTGAALGVPAGLCIGIGASFFRTDNPQPNTSDRPAPLARAAIGVATAAATSLLGTGIYFTLWLGMRAIGISTSANPISLLRLFTNNPKALSAALNSVQEGFWSGLLGSVALGSFIAFVPCDDRDFCGN